MCVINSTRTFSRIQKPSVKKQKPISNRENKTVSYHPVSTAYWHDKKFIQVKVISDTSNTYKTRDDVDRLIDLSKFPDNQRLFNPSQTLRWWFVNGGVVDNESGRGHLVVSNSTDIIFDLMVIDVIPMVYQISDRQRAQSEVRRNALDGYDSIVFYDPNKFTEYQAPDSYVTNTYRIYPRGKQQVF